MIRHQSQIKINLWKSRKKVKRLLGYNQWFQIDNWYFMTFSHQKLKVDPSKHNWRKTNLTYQKHLYKGKNFRKWTFLQPKHYSENKIFGRDHDKTYNARTHHSKMLTFLWRSNEIWILIYKWDKTLTILSLFAHMWQPQVLFLQKFLFVDVTKFSIPKLCNFCTWVRQHSLRAFFDSSLCC